MFRVLLIGLGKIGQEYDYELNERIYILSHAQAIAVDHRFELVAGIDPSKSKTELFSKKFNKPAYNSLEEFCPRSVNPDVIVIATPVSTHSKILSDVLNIYKPKVILCEKPIALNVTEAKYMLKLCEVNNVNLFINFIRRTNPTMQNLNLLISDKRLEKPFSGLCWYSHGLYNTASHFCDLFQFFFGDPIGYNAQSVSQFDDTTLADPQISFILKFKEGEIEFKPVPNSKLFHNKFELIFQNCAVSYQQNGDVYFSYKDGLKSSIDRIILSNSKDVVAGNMDRYQKYVYDNLFLALNGSDNDLTSAKDAMVIMKIFEQLKKGSVH